MPIRLLVGAALVTLISAAVAQPEGFAAALLARSAGPAMLVALGLTAAGVGRAIRCKHADNSFGTVEALCCDVAVGWAALGAGLTLLAACHLLSLSLVAPLSLLLFVGFGLGLRNAGGGWNAWMSVPWRRLAGLAARHQACRIPMLLTWLLWIDALLWALGPVWDWDSEMYHLSCAEFLLKNHGMAVSAVDPLLNIPGQMYVWYALGVAGGQTNFAALLMWGATILTSLMAASFAARRIGTTVGMWTVPVFWSGAIVTAVAITPRVEPYCALMFVAAFSLVEQALRSPAKLRFSPFLLAGLCLGTAGASKYQALYGWVVLGGWLAWLWLRDHNLRHARSLVAGVLLFSAALLVSAPWWGKNLVAFGNPVYPVLAKADPASLTHAQSFETGRVTGVWPFLKMTVDIFLKPNGFNGTPNHFPHYLFIFFPLVLLLRPPRVVAWLAWMAIAYFIVNMGLTPITRYMFPIFAAFSICTAYVIVQLTARLQMRALFPGLAALLIAHALLIPARSFATPALLGYLAGSTTEGEFLARMSGSGFHEATTWINENTPPDAQILMCWDARQYRIRRRTIIDPAYATWAILFKEGRSTPDDVRRYLESRDIDYLLVNEGALEFNVTRSKRITEAAYQTFELQRELLVGTVLDPVLVSRRVTVYKVGVPQARESEVQPVPHGK